MTEQTMKCGDLFAGAGGLSAGFHEAGFRSLFFSEWDEDAAATYRLNFPDAVPFVGDIRALTAEAVLAACPEAAGLDVLAGGPPCQGFSINAPVRDAGDPRNHLFREYVRLLEGLRPAFVLLENVPGLLSMSGGQVVKDVQEAFRLAGYRTAYRILNAAHYGAPQERWRLVMVGTRLAGVELSLPQPTHCGTRVANFTGGAEHTFRHALRKKGQPPPLGLLATVTVGEAIGDLPAIPSGGGAAEMAYTLAPDGPFQGRARAGSASLHNHECAGLSAENLARMAHVLPGGSWRDIPHHLLPAGMRRARKSDHTRRYGRLHPHEPSGTVLTKCDPHWGTVVHYAQDRVLSVREAARIQSFPDTFRFTGGKPAMYRQAGNAVPPLLARAVARHLAGLLAAAKALGLAA
jgi:DNA (cytosine-5)-methyltransferase 1